MTVPKSHPQFTQGHSNLPKPPQAGANSSTQSSDFKRVLGNVSVPDELKHESGRDRTQTEKPIELAPLTRSEFHSLSSEVDNFTNLALASSERDEYAPKTPSDLPGIDYTGAQIEANEEALSKITRELETNEAAKILYLRNAQLGPHSFSALFKTLKSNTSIQHLVLDNTKLGQGRSLADFKISGSLEVLVRQTQNPNIATDFALAGLADLLRINHIVGWLILNNNLIDDEGARVLSTGIAQNKGVQHLVLSDNRITDKGVPYLTQAIQKNPTIETLFLQGNQIGNNSLDDLLGLIQNRQKPLKILDLRDNTIDDEDVIEALIKAAQQRGTRLYLDPVTSEVASE